MKLYETLKKYKDRRFLMITPNKGNFGDYIIRYGALKMFKDLGIKYMNWSMLEQGMMKLKKGNEDVIFYIHGCGGIGKTYDYPTVIIKKLAEQNPENKIIWGPTTAMLHKDFLLDWLIPDKNDFTFFAREKVTFNFLKEIMPDLNLKIDHCPSLYLKKEDFNIKESNNKYNALFLRQDHFEMIDNPFINSMNKFDKVIDPVDVESFDEWVSLHANAKTITTNRTHSAIMGHILNIPTKMFKNNYHKNKSVFDYSLNGIGSVEWLDV